MSPSSVKKRFDDIHKSSLDVREYRLLKLSNELLVLLVHDPNADMAAAAMNVGVGALIFFLCQNEKFRK